MNVSVTTRAPRWRWYAAGVITSATAIATSEIAARCSSWSGLSRSSAKRWLKTAISWKPKSAWIPGSTMRHSSRSVLAASASSSSSHSSRTGFPRMSIGDRTHARRLRRAPPFHRGIGGEKLRRFVAPLELVHDAPAPELAHRRAARRIVDELDDLRREVGGIVLARVHRGLLRGEPAFGEVELHDGLAERHVLHDL